MKLLWIFIGLLPLITASNRLVELACARDPSLPYCAGEKEVIRRSQPLSPEDPFGEKFEPRTRAGEKEGFVPQSSIELLEEVEETTSVRPVRIRSTTPLPRQNLLYTIFPTLQKEKNPRKYCPLNQYTFQVTCLPGKKLRYDLMIFCEEYSETCGVPNISLYPSKHGRGGPREDEGRPIGYGQKQKNGNLGLGRSFAFGVGALPGFEVVASQGTDIGKENLPGLNQIGGLMFNQGVEIGATGKRIGKGPARTMDALGRGYPSLGGLLGQSDPTEADKRATAETLRSFGIPNVAGLNKIFGALGPKKKPGPPSRVAGYEPGYGALNKKAPLALGKVDHDSINLPGGLGDFEINKGGGFGLGK